MDLDKNYLKVLNEQIEKLINKWLRFFYQPNKEKIFRQTLNNNAPKELFYGILASNLIDFNKDCIDTRNFINSKFEKICDILINSSFSKKNLYP